MTLSTFTGTLRWGSGRSRAPPRLMATVAHASSPVKEVTIACRVAAAPPRGPRCSMCAPSRSAASARRRPPARRRLRAAPSTRASAPTRAPATVSAAAVLSPAGRRPCAGCRGEGGLPAGVDRGRPRAGSGRRRRPARGQRSAATRGAAPEPARCGAGGPRRGISRIARSPRGRPAGPRRKRRWAGPLVAVPPTRWCVRCQRRPNARVIVCETPLPALSRAVTRSVAKPADFGARRPVRQPSSSRSRSARCHVFPSS